jgi:hypothetical protein
MPHDPWRNVRKVERDQVDFHATLRRPGGSAMDARVVDLSPRGFMVRIDGPFEPEERVLIDLPVVGEVTARVAWALGGRLGGQLLVPIPKPDYDELLATATTQLRRRWPA